MAALGAKIDKFGNPLKNTPTSLVNIATGLAASQSTKSYLLGALK